MKKIDQRPGVALTAALAAHRADELHDVLALHFGRYAGLSYGPRNDTRQHEQEFHDREYVNAVSRAPDKYYSIADGARETFRRRIEGIVPGDEVLEYGCGPWC